MSELRAVIFDVDGTMADTERDGHRVAFNRAFAESGLEWNWDVSLYGDLLAVAGGKERIRFYVDNYRPDFTAPDNLDQFIALLHAAKTKHYQQLVASGAIPLRPGVKRLLQEARNSSVRLAMVAQRTAFGIATTSALPNVMALLQLSLAPDAPDWFEVIAAGDNRAYQKACTRHLSVRARENGLISAKLDRD